MKNVKMAVILTALSDDPSRPTPPGFTFEELFFQPIAGQLAASNFFQAVSYGQVDFTGSRVFDWVEAKKPDNTPMDVATYMAYPGGGDPRRQERARGGIRGAIAAGHDLSQFNVIVTFCNHVPGDTFGSGGAYIPELNRVVGIALIDPGGWDTFVSSHEAGHAMGFSHPFGPYGGEYGDPWDTMGDPFKFATGDATLKNSGPWYSAASLRLRDWVPSDRVMSVPIDGAALENCVLRLAALNYPEADGPLVMELVPPSWPASGSIYTVEFRRKDGFDQGIPTDAVLIHMRRSGSNNPVFLATTPGAPKEASGMTEGYGKWRVPGTGLDVVVQSIDSSRNVAHILFSPADIAVNLSYRIRIVSKSIGGFGVYDWPGAIVLLKIANDAQRRATSTPDTDWCSGPR